VNASKAGAHGLQYRILMSLVSALTRKLLWRLKALAIAMLVAGTLMAPGSAARAQDIEPRAYSNAPVGVNFLIPGYAYTDGGVSFDTSLPLTNPNLTTSNLILAYARSLDLWGKSGKFNVIAPYGWLSGSADYDGETVHRNISGFGDPALLLSINLYGAPALSAREFAQYHQDLIVGASLRVTAPLGQYDDTRLVNLGTNRWSFKPQLGVSKALGRWTLEGTAAVTFYTDNNDFFGGNDRSQDPLYSLGVHVIYSFRSGIWGSLDGTYFEGGRTTLDRNVNNDLQQNWRVGATLALPVNARNSVKAFASSGVSARTGNNYDLYGIAWQYRWGGGL
jgi:hypothetical protein